jgi:hypothetical protein
MAERRQLQIGLFGLTRLRIPQLAKQGSRCQPKLQLWF